MTEDKKTDSAKKESKEEIEKKKNPVKKHISVPRNSCCSRFIDQY
jgi:hypothetical protein